ncbi:MAG: TolB family protein [Anaerolineales bacterium]|nr:TolB family protein [Anaerolineales bacterium]
MNKLKTLLTISLLLSILGCNRPIPVSPTPDLFATLQASTPASSSPAATESLTTPVLDLPAPDPNSSAASTSVPSPSPADGLTGHIVFTCQLFKVQSRDQICIMNADGSGMRRLTTADNKRHYYASLAPDGGSIVYSSYREDNVYEIYHLDLNDGSVDRLTDKLGVLTGAEFSPDGKSIVFARGNASGKYQVMVMDRNGKDVGDIPQASGWDPTWSPDGEQILFASGAEAGVQLFVVKRNGKDLHQVTDLPAIRGRSDWSPDGGSIVTYAGPSWNREVYILNADGSNARQLTPVGGNSQGPSFSPDGKWVAFTAYFDNYGDVHGCEIYVIRTDGTDLRRLTDNDYCDYQPRWGP